VDRGGRDRWVNAARLPDLGTLAQRILDYDQAARAADTGTPAAARGPGSASGDAAGSGVPGTP